MAGTTKPGRSPGAARTGRMSNVGRMGRTSSAGQGRFARSTSTPRRSTPNIALRRRREPQRSGFQKVFGAIVPMGAAKKATPSSKKGKAGGFALVAAAAGMALKNRDKLTQLRHRGSESDRMPSTTGTVNSSTSTGTSTSTSTPPSTPSV